MTQKSELRLVPMTPALVGEVALLEQICFSDPWSRQALAAELEEPVAAWLVALDGKRPVGYIGLHIAADEGEIVNLAVSPGWRKKGVGAALLGTVLAFPWWPWHQWFLNVNSGVGAGVAGTVILALTGISIGTKLADLKKISWRIAIVSIFVFCGTFFGSAIVAQIIMKIQGII